MQKIEWKYKVVKASDRVASTSLSPDSNLSVNTRRPEPKSAFQKATEFLLGGKTADEVSASIRNRDLDALARFASGN